MIKPNVIMVTGPNGAGKTSSIMKLLPDFLHMREFVNADEIARGLSPLNPSSTKIEAGRLMLKRIHSLIEQRKNFAFETTGASYLHTRTLKYCREAGYDIAIIFLYLSSVNIAIERVKLRVFQGGHDIPETDILRRYTKGLRMFFMQYISLADSTEIYDNSHGEPVLIAKKLSINTPWIVQQERVWQNIQEKINEKTAK